MIYYIHQVLPLSLRNGRKPAGTVTLKAEEVSTCADIAILHFAGAKLVNKDGFFGKSDPFLQVSRIREDGSSVVVWKSEVVENNLNPMWKPASIEVSACVMVTMTGQCEIVLSIWSGVCVHLLAHPYPAVTWVRHHPAWVRLIKEVLF